MPELPEVETVVNDLNRRVVGRKIVSVWANWPQILRTPSFPKFRKEIRAQKITRVMRRGKNILFFLIGPRGKKEYLLLIHLKMTGHPLVGKWRIVRRGGVESAVSLSRGRLGEKINSYIHIIFYLDNGKMIALSDARKFAKIVFGKREEIEKSEHLAKLGREPLDPKLTLNGFSDIVSRGKRKIKQVLMDQERIVGIGNIYADEILWKARVNPLRIAASLRSGELNNIYKSMRRILKRAIKLRGTSFSDFRDTSGRPGFYSEKRLVYGREDKLCLRCGRSIKKVKIGSRSSYFCGHCQQ